MESFLVRRTAFVSKENIQRKFPNLKTPLSCEELGDIRELACITKIVEWESAGYDETRWRIVGWHAPISVNTRHLLIVLENVK